MVNETSPTGRPKGVLNGFRESKLNPSCESEEAEQVVKIMSEQYGIEDNYAQEALQTAVEVMRVQVRPEGLAAARLVLDFTKTKPVAKSEVTIGKAKSSYQVFGRRWTRLQQIRKRLFNIFLFTQKVLSKYEPK